MVFADQALKQVVSKPRPVSHRLEIPLNPVDSDREHVDEAELLRILRQRRSERTCDIVAKLGIQAVWQAGSRGET